jgi:N-acylneuraminate cytidylyltransferase
MSNLAIIPARGGSKRIPRKNIRDFMGKPIIAYSIEVALKSNLFDEVMVSTDDIEIAEIALKYGAKVPFLRNEKSADDFASTTDVLIEAINEYEKLKLKFDYGCCIYPTAPLLKLENLIKAYNLLVNQNFESVFPITKFSYPILRALELTNNKVKMIWEENIKKRSQDMPKAFHDSGQFYWFKISNFLISQKIFTENSGAIELNELEVQDIDNEMDWKLAQLKFQLLNDS